MNKALKITLISLGSLLGILLLTIIIVCWIVVTPARLTSIVRNQAPNFITCDFSIEKADLTIFKSFPKIGLEIDNVVLVNPMEGSPSDTLAYIEECVVSVDIKKFLKEDLILIDECRLNGGKINLFTDNNQNTNLDIFPPSEPDTTVTEENSEFNYAIDLVLLEFNDITMNYTDLTQGLCAEIDGFNVKAKGNMKENNVAGDLEVSLRKMLCKQESDSLSMAVKLNDLNLEGDAAMIGDNLKANVNASSSILSYEDNEQTIDLNALNLKYTGDINNYDHIKGNAEMSVNDLSYILENEQLLNKADVKMIAPLNASLSNMDVELGASQFALNNIFINLIGKVQMPDNDIIVDINLNTNTLIVEELIELVPESMREELLAGIDVKGELQLTANVEGVYNDSSMPAVNAKIQYDKGMISMAELLPYPLTNINTSINADINLNEQSDIYVDYLNADMSKSSFNISGTIKDVMDKMLCSIKLNANANLDELQAFMPEEIKAKGNMKMNLNAAVNNEQLTNMNFMKSDVNGNLSCSDLNLVYCDTINVKADKLNISLDLPNSASEDLTNSLAAITINGTNCDAEISDMIIANLENYNIKAQVSNILDENVPMSVYADYSFGRVDANMDDMSLLANNPEGSLAIFMKENSNDASYIAVYDGDSLSFNMGDEMSFVTESLDFNVSADYDDDQEDLLLQWNPHAGIRLNEARFAMSELSLPIYIPSIDFQYDTTGIEIKNSSVVLGNSDFELQGKFTSVDEFLRKEDLLRGTLDFTSHYTDVNQIMEIFNGMGDTTMVAEEVVVTDTIATPVAEDNPFIVPLGVNITLNTNIEKAVAGEMSLSNIGGGVTVKNGVLVLKEVGFTSEAATMKVTAMYKSPRRNHLYLGLDLHLLEIDIAEMIDLIPELDTLVPMLNSFAGKAEFHFAAETYMKSNYDLKISTLRGATAIHGKDLVILDNKTYKKLGRLLGFKDKEHNKIDNLNVEITAFKNEIDVYPTLITVDKYQAIVEGRHNLNMTFDYKLGMTNPWPFKRMGIIVRGNEEDLKFKFKRKKTMNIENPEKNGKNAHVAKETLRLKQLIYESLK